MESKAVKFESLYRENLKDSAQKRKMKSRKKRLEELIFSKRRFFAY